MDWEKRVRKVLKRNPKSKVRPVFEESESVEVFFEGLSQIKDEILTVAAILGALIEYPKAREMMEELFST
jgi:hypothetical protein